MNITVWAVLILSYPSHSSYRATLRTAWWWGPPPAGGSRTERSPPASTWWRSSSDWVTTGQERERERPRCDSLHYDRPQFSLLYRNIIKYFIKNLTLFLTISNQLPCSKFCQDLERPSDQCCRWEGQWSSPLCRAILRQVPPAKSF